VVDRLLPKREKAVRLGITGVPGVGKSTFIESFGMMLVEKGHKVAVLAVDPVQHPQRRQHHGRQNPHGAAIRCAERLHPPVALRRHLGGVARMTRETLLVCEAAGFDVMIVETVGVGQSETTVASMVDFFLVLMLAGAGDELQGIKKGVLELADAVAINKADGDNVEKAAKARRSYEMALHLLNPATPTWSPPVLTCSALTMAGVDNLWATVKDHRQRLSATGELEEKRRRQALAWMWSRIEDGLKERFFGNPEISSPPAGGRSIRGAGRALPHGGRGNPSFFA
jgi:LAO/AO transport system kinase